MLQPCGEGNATDFVCLGKWEKKIQVILWCSTERQHTTVCLANTASSPTSQSSREDRKSFHALAV